MTIRRPKRLYDVYIFDLDGTVYLGDALLPTAGETLHALRAHGRRVLFVSNNPTRTREEYAQKLTRLGVPTPPEDVINSTVVLVDFLRHELPNGRLFVIGEEPLCRTLHEAGFELCDDPQRIDAVIASFDRTFDYRKLQIGFDALRNGARFFATNADRYCPVPGGGQPDAAAVIAALEASTGRTVEAVVGKPSRYMIETILRLVQRPPDACLMVGDRLETDVRMGLDAGMPSALTLTGATDAETVAHSPVQPTYVIAELADLLRETPLADTIAD
ncbi:MAG: HAD-IIA family hydrolase [Ardenticatenia bacterium]|nr:MAG: HAD-IIA family hydrolase [Ardenticatenia bacterium]